MAELREVQKCGIKYLYFYFTYAQQKSEPKQRKSSLATAVGKTDQRKKSVTMVVERNETVEFEKPICCEEETGAEEANKDNFNPESPSGQQNTNIVTNKSDT